MRIAVSSEGQQPSSMVDPRFGRAKWFILYDTESEIFESFDNSQVLNLPQGAGIQAAQQVIDRKAEVVLTGHCGPNAFKTLLAGEVQVVVGASGTVLEAVNKYQKGDLKPADSADVDGHW